MSDAMVAELLQIFREEALELVQRTLASLNRAVNSSGADRKKELAEVSRLLHTLKGAAAAADQELVHHRAHALEDRVLALTPDAQGAAFDVIFREVEDIEATVLGQPRPQVVAPPPVQVQKRVPSAPVKPLEAPESSNAPSAPQGEQRTQANEWLRIPPERVDQLYAQLGELVLTRLQQDVLVDRMVELRGLASRTVALSRELHRAIWEARSSMPAEHLRRLTAGSEDVSRMLGQLFDGLSSTSREARGLQAQSSLVNHAIEESIEDLRLMPLQPFFEGFGKVVRDAARRSDKLVRFEVKADGAEVDRTVLSRLSDAFLHLLRNAVGHGLETPSERLALGKPEQGELMLFGTTQGTHAVIEVRDDGAGIDETRVREKARLRGLPDSEDILDILAHPGFSTRDTADALSGRGVGLDVVRDAVHALGGELLLESKRGRGTTFTIRVPITASTTMGLILAVGERRFGVMLSDVESVVRPAPEDIVQLEGRPAVRLGSELVGLVALADVLGLAAAPSSDERLPIVVLKQVKKRVAILVSDIPSEHALVVRPFGRAFHNNDLFVGGAVQPDHSVVPVLSTPALFARATRTSGVRAPNLTVERVRTQGAGLSALVVDDSITMRTLIRNVLTAAGYSVTTAEDGEEGLRALADMTECHVVITDLQMPRMDGMELCRNIRARHASYVPIVMVTSVDDDTEKSRALAAGADAYVIKSQFEQSSFLKRVDMLVRGPT
jgi:chemotaxis protein histidine kinase CheA/CheY-like chemotaxis protein